MKINTPNGENHPNWKGLTIITCKICQNTFKVAYYRKDKAKFCSHKCYSSSLKGTKPMLGFKHTKNSKLKMRLSHLGKPNHRKGKTFPHLRKRRIIPNGYIFIYMPKHPFADRNGHIREHRYVAEISLGRFLEPEEIIHHINENKHDNRLENLYLFKNNGEHRKFHGKNNKHFIISNLIKH